MKQELELKVQAYLDGELSDREAREFAAGIGHDPESQALLAELKTTTAVLRENEPQATLPEAREFYWSKIERAIEHAQPESVLAVFRARFVETLFSLRRAIVPAAGVALVLFLGIASFKFHTANDPAVHLAEVESLSEHVSSFSFRSQSANVFVVWLHENADQQAMVDPDADFDDAILQ